MTKVKRFGVISVANISGIMYFLGGILAAIYVAVIFSMMSAFSPGDLPGVFPFVFGGAMIFILPVIYGVMGWIVGLISAAVYNLIAKWIGGIEVEIEQQS